MYSLTHPALVAGGNVRPARLIALDATNPAVGNEATDPTVPLIGVSYEETRIVPGGLGDDGYCAIANEPLPYHGPLQTCNVTLGATLAAHVACTTDNAGRAVAAGLGSATTVWAIGFTLQAGVANDRVLFYVTSPWSIRTA
jgi:hypothetical protein